MFKPFQEFLEEELFKRFELSRRSIPPGLQFKVSERGKHSATSSSWRYRCRQRSKISYTYTMNADEPVQIFKPVIYPSQPSGLPLFGINFYKLRQEKNFSRFRLSTFISRANLSSKIYSAHAPLGVKILRIHTEVTNRVNHLKC